MITKNKHLTPTEQQALKETLQIDNIKTTYILFLLSTGARCSEALNLTRDSFELDHDGLAVVHIEGLKGSNDRTIPISLELYKRCTQAFLDRGKLFSFSDSRARQIWYEVRPKNLEKKLHSLRHTFAINLYRNSKDIMQVKYALGHRSLNSTLVYSQYVDGVEGLRRSLAC